LKEIQRLVSQLTLLAWFLQKLTERINMILKIMKKQTTDKWDEQCDSAFQEFKTVIASPPIMCRPIPSIPLQLYLNIIRNH